jgi:cbb3-type cytochrome oxidase subunit 3
LREALVRRFQWEILFAIENGEKAIARGEQTHIGGCVYRALCCIGQVLFALNRRYLINEKGALDEAARLPLTLDDLPSRVADVWRAVGTGTYNMAFRELRRLDDELRTLSARAR